MSIPLKPLVPLALLAVSLAGIGLLATRNERSDQYNELQATQIGRMREHARHELDTAHAFLRAAAANPALKTLSPSERVLALAEAAPHFQLTVVSLHDQANNTLYLANAPSRAGELYGFEPLLKAAYAGGKPLSFAGEYRGKPALMFAEPLLVDGQIRGQLLAARLLDQTYVNGLHQATGLSVQLAVAGQNLAAGATGEAKAVNLDLDGGVPLALSLRLPPRESGGNWPIASAALLLGALGLGLGWYGLRQRRRRVDQLQYALASLEAPPDAQAKALAGVAAQAQAGDELDALVRLIHQTLSGHAIALAELQKGQRQAGQTIERLNAEARALSQARDEALRAPRTKSEFLSRMGDEITTPMHSVVSMLDLLREYELPSEPRELLSIAHRSAHTLAENLINILDFSKLDAGLLRLHQEPFQVAGLIGEIVGQLKPHATDKGLRLDYNLAEGVPATVLGDPARIKQILSNLVGNAIRFTREGEVAVYVDILQPAEERFLRFSVVDTGVGIPKDAQAGLFDSLNQRSRLTTASFAGRLRLIVAKELSALMGGQIGVSSEPNKGSRFWFTIKLVH